MNKKKILVAVAWPYVNGDIHLGHLAGYLLPADICVRFQRFIGNDVLMVSGSDCFGTPVSLEADKRKVTPEKIVNEYHPKNVTLFKNLNLSFDIYTKTDNPVHKEIVQDIFIKLLNKDLIYADDCEQYYSESEKRFLPDRYVEGICPHCDHAEARSDQCDNCGRLINMGELKNPISKLTKTPVVIKKSEHYFFAWQKLEKFLKKYLADYSSNWRNWISNEAQRWLADGLKPRAITRDIDWGIEIPADKISADKLIKGHEHKRIYVWFEAVIGYLSATIQYAREHDTPDLWQDFWHNTEAKHYYFMGKDNLVFHTLFWPGQLHGYDEKLHLPDIQAINQFLTLNHKGFSKSRGITLDPEKIIKDFGLDTVRFYLTLIMPENHDSDFTWSDFIVKTNNLIIANLGNLLFRTMKLAEGLDIKKSTPESTITKLINNKLSEAKKLLDGCHFKQYAELILELSAIGNKYLSDETPWKLKKESPEKYNAIMTNALYFSLALTILIKPIMPETSEKLEKMLGIKIDSWPDKETIIDLVKKVKIKNPEPLFKKIDVDPEKEKFNEKYR